MYWPDEHPCTQARQGSGAPEREQVALPSRSPLSLCFLHHLAGCSQENLCGLSVYTRKLVVSNKALCTEHLWESVWDTGKFASKKRTGRLSFWTSFEPLEFKNLPWADNLYFLNILIVKYNKYIKSIYVCIYIYICKTHISFFFLVEVYSFWKF